MNLNCLERINSTLDKELPTEIRNIILDYSLTRFDMTKIIFPGLNIWLKHICRNNPNISDTTGDYLGECMIGIKNIWVEASCKYHPRVDYILGIDYLLDRTVTDYESGVKYGLKGVRAVIEDEVEIVI